MKTEILKISIAQRILNSIVGYDADGSPISEKEYTKDIYEALHQLSEGKLETYSNEEIRKKILG